MSFGLFACVPSFLAARWLRSRLLTVAGFGYLAAIVVFLACSTTTGPAPESAAMGITDVIGMLTFLGAWLGGTVHAVVLQAMVNSEYNQRVWTQQAVGEQATLVAARQRKARRAEARALVASDPVLASELGIGRPDLRRGHDDGGLVDVNHVPAEVLAADLEMTPEVARQVVDAREHLGGFHSAEEMIVYCEGVTPQRVEYLRDRLLFLPA